MSNSCVGCKFLYGQGYGYSNYTWENTNIKCALNRNQHLLGDVEEGFDWIIDPSKDNCPATRDSRCECYAVTPVDLLLNVQNGLPFGYFHLDVDGEDGAADFTKDPDAILAISKHADRGLHGGSYVPITYHDLIHLLNNGT